MNFTVLSKVHVHILCVSSYILFSVPKFYRVTEGVLFVNQDLEEVRLYFYIWGNATHAKEL